MTPLIEQCYQKSIELLHKNSDQYGILASGVSQLAKDKNYRQLFGRDTSICALGLVSTKDKKNLKLAKTSLLSLAHLQSSKGQIPYSYNFKTRQSKYWSPGNLDSTLWWLIACLVYIRETKNKTFIKIISPKITKALTWLSYQDQNEDGLLEQGDGGDWADEMPNRGVVLYSNILWHKALSLITPLSRVGELKLPTIKLVKSGINSLLWQPSGKINIYLKKNFYIKKFISTATNLTQTKLPYFLNYFSHRQFGTRCDACGNILAILFGLASKKQSEQIIKYILNKKLNKPFPVVVYYPPIKKADSDWTGYMLHRNQNRPWYYQNGGIWPYVGGFWVMALNLSGNKKLAKQELEKLAQSNKLNNWEFNEFLHGKTGKPMGVKKQSWNAGTFILAYHCLKGGFTI
jgi:GH15 family glucan-1,4-alpha-glucosidase